MPEKKLIRTEYIRHPVYDGHTIHTWIYHFDDGSRETKRERRKSE